MSGRYTPRLYTAGPVYSEGVSPEEGRQRIEEVVGDEFFAEETAQHKDTMRVLLATLLIGTDADSIARFLNLNRDKFVRPRIRRLRQNGVLQGCTVVCDWYEEDGSVCLMLDALVAEGSIVRCGGEPGAWEYDVAKPDVPMPASYRAPVGVE